MENRSPLPGDLCRYLATTGMTYSTHVLISFLPLLVTGCDPGYSYTPLNSSNEPVSSWTTDIEGVNIRIPGFDILVGEGNMLQWITITNNSNSDVVLLNGTLTTKGNSISADLPGEGELKWRTVAPGESVEITCLFDLWSGGGTADDVLDQTIVWEWEFQIEGKTRKLPVKMRRRT